jgi:F0F1-type ATP synthase membrane subunit b/b'
MGTASSNLESLTRDSEERLTDAKRKISEANTYYEEVVSKSKADAEKIRQQLIDEGLKEKQELLERSRKESEATMERARSARKLLEENWSQELTGKARDVTYRILQAVLPGKVSQSLQSQWFQDALESNFDGLSHLNVPGDVTRVDVVSASPLTETQKKALEVKLKEKIGRAVAIDEKIDEKLILGFCLSMGSVVIDSSLSWKIKETLRDERFEKD